MAPVSPAGLPIAFQTKSREWCSPRLPTRMKTFSKEPLTRASRTRVIPKCLPGPRDWVCCASPQKYLPEMLRVYFGSYANAFPPKTTECEIAFLHQTRHVQSFMIERARSTPKEEIEDVAACTRGFGNMPLVVLSEKWVYSPNADEQEKVEARREAERHARLAALSTRGKKIDLESGHLIPLESPSAVVDAVRQVVLTAQSVQQGRQCLDHG